MKILVLTGHTFYVNDYAAFTMPIMRAYCERHGYDFVCETNMQEWDIGRPYPWAKLLFIKKWLESKRYDLVVWMDADIVVMNHAITWQEILATRLGNDVYISEETIVEGVTSRKNVNTGVMAFKNSDFSFQLLGKMWEVPNPVDTYKWHEQSRLIEILKRDELPEKDRLALCPQKLFNSMPTNDSYTEGDFLVHFAGYEEVFTDKKRVDAIRAFSLKVLPLIAKPHYPTLDAYFYHSVVINLDRREDRWTKFKNASQDVVCSNRISALDAKTQAIPDYVYRLKDTAMFTLGAWALAKTTHNIIQYALDHHFDNVLIMEDDIEFSANSREYLFHAMLELPNDWEILFLSQYQLRAPKEIGLTYWQKPRYTFSCAMYVVRSSVFKEYLHFLQRPEIPIDNYLVEYIQPRGRCYSLRQSIAYQISGESDIDPTSAKKWKINEMNHNILVRS